MIKCLLDLASRSLKEYRINTAAYAAGSDAAGVSSGQLSSRATRSGLGLSGRVIGVLCAMVSASDTLRDRALEVSPGAANHAANHASPCRVEPLQSRRASSPPCAGRCH